MPCKVNEFLVKTQEKKSLFQLLEPLDQDDDHHAQVFPINT